MQFVNDMEFDRLGAFTYSAGGRNTGSGNAGSGAAGTKKEEWQADVMELQEEVIFLTRMKP